MIILITGLPGAGKTLWCLNWVVAKAEKESRPVFYSGITDLNLPWTEIDPEKWMDAPANSIVVIDECQRVFRPRMHGSTVPPHVSELETHRHKGIDIVLITQHPMLLDSNARRLVGLHFHCVRKFGTQSSTVHEWASVKENCDKNREDSTRHDFIFPKKSYEWYKSAEVHTHKARIPGRIFLIVGMLLLAVSAVVYLVWSFQHKADPPKVVSPAPGTSASGPGLFDFPAEFPLPGRSRAAPSDDKKRPLTATEYALSHRPRIAGLEFTAPAYDKITEPVRAPYPAACVATASRCLCYSQQATRLSVPDRLCGAIVQGGFFLAWDTDGRARDRQLGPDERPRSPAALLPSPVSSQAVAAAPVSLGASSAGPGVHGLAGRSWPQSFGMAGPSASPSPSSVDGEVLAWMHSR